MAKERKKSLVGWTRKDWQKFMRLVSYPKYSSQSILIPCINSNPVRHPTRRYPKVKVRITIEQIK